MMVMGSDEGAVRMDGAGHSDLIADDGLTV